MSGIYSNELVYIKRKVCQIGPATLMVSLPSKWVKINNIKKGDEIELREVDHSLVVKPASANGHHTSIEINFESAKGFNKRGLEIPYIEGVDEINVTYNDPDVFPLVQTEVDRLHGLEIVDQKSNKILIKNIARGENEELDVLIRRIFLMLINSVEESSKHLKDNNYRYVQDMINTEKISAKLIHFSLRALNLYGFKNQKKTYAVFSMIWAVEQILDSYRDIAKHIIKDKPKITKEGVTIYEKVLKYMKKFYDILYSYDHKKFVDFYEYKKELEKEILSTIKKKDSDKLLLTYLHGIFDRIYHMGIFVSPTNKNFM